MKPYLAIIVDSFHAALSSRILWIAFLAIWIFLIALAPIGYHEDYTTTFRWFDLDNGTQMKAMLARGLVDPKESESALGRVSRIFPEPIERKLRQVAKGEDVRVDKVALAEAFNKALDDESWYDPDAWESTVRLKELRELDEKSDDELSDSERRRRARLRIEAALPGVFAVQSARSIMLSYAGFEFPAFFAIGKTQFAALINQFVVPVIMDWLLGFALIFLGILVTASIIPEMLQPGSLHLLLSKPISRTLLLLSKFVGACAFVFLCVCQLVIGLYLIAGLRLDIWNARILWCIPVAVFLFSVFYSVSLLAGLRWRSPTLSIGVSCMFGAFVLVIGFIGGYFDGLVRRPDQITHLSMDRENFISVTRGGGLKRFDKPTNGWVSLIENDFRRRDLIVPPVRLSDSVFGTAQIRNGRFNLYGSGSLDLLVLNESDSFEPRPGMRLPNGTRRMYAFGETLLALNNAGLMATSMKEAGSSAGSEGEDSDENGEADASRDAEVATDSPEIGVTAWISDLVRMQGGATEGFENVLPNDVALNDPVRLALVPDLESVVIYARGRMVRLARNDREASESDFTFDIAADVTLESNDAAAITIGASGRSVLVARQDEPVRWMDAGDLSTLAEFESPNGEQLTRIVGLGQGDRFAMLTTEGRVWMAERNGNKVTQWSLTTTEVTTIQLNHVNGQLAVAHHVDSVDFYEFGNNGESVGTVVETLRPRLTGWRSVDQWLITPLRTLTPQTGELSQTVAALVSGKTSYTLGGNDEDDTEVIRLKIVRPVISCSVFTVVMLAISCVYFIRRDF